MVKQFYCAVKKVKLASRGKIVLLKALAEQPELGFKVQLDPLEVSARAVRQVHVGQLAT